MASIDSDNDDSKVFGSRGFAGGFAPYGGAFSNVPDRVGSAPATDLSVVIFRVNLNDCTLEQVQAGISAK